MWRPAFLITILVGRVRVPLSSFRSDAVERFVKHRLVSSWDYWRYTTRNHAGDNWVRRPGGFAALTIWCWRCSDRLLHCINGLLPCRGRHIVPFVDLFGQWPESFRLLHNCREDAYESRVSCFVVSPCDRNWLDLVGGLGRFSFVRVGHRFREGLPRLEICARESSDSWWWSRGDCVGPYCRWVLASRRGT